MSRSGSALRRLPGDARGATAIEFGLIIGAAIMLVIGTVEVGRLLSARNEVSHALSQTVRQVHLNPEITPTEIRTHLEGLLDATATLEVCVEPVPETSIAHIRVVFPFQLRIPFVAVGDLNIPVETIAPRIKNEVDLTDTCTA